MHGDLTHSNLAWRDLESEMVWESLPPYAFKIHNRTRVSSRLPEERWKKNEQEYRGSTWDEAAKKRLLGLTGASFSTRRLLIAWRGLKRPNATAASIGACLGSQQAESIKFCWTLARICYLTERSHASIWNACWQLQDVWLWIRLQPWRIQWQDAKAGRKSQW